MGSQPSPLSRSYPSLSRTTQPPWKSGSRSATPLPAAVERDHFLSAAHSSPSLLLHASPSASSAARNGASRSARVQHVVQDGRPAPTSGEQDPHSASVAGGGRFALLLHGMVGAVEASATDAIRVLRGGSLRLATFAGLTQLEFIVRANEAAGGVDVFIHSWNPELASLIDGVYGTALRRSLHQPLEVHNRVQSQARSIGRAAALVSEYERARGREFSIVLTMRLDLVVGAPVRLEDFSPAHIWFNTACCRTSASTESDQTFVHSVCGPLERNVSRFPTGSQLLGVTPQAVGKQQARNDRARYFARVVSYCRPSHKISARKNHSMVMYSRAYFLHDWWFAARTGVVASFAEIDRNWSWYSAELREAGAQEWSHYVWPLHVHDVLNLSSAVRFSNGMRARLARFVWPHVAWPTPKARGTPYLESDPVAEYDKGDGPAQVFNKMMSSFIGDVIGSCPAVRTLDGRHASYPEILRQPIVRGASGLYPGRLPERFASMAAQCPLRLLPQKVVCCGMPRVCGVEICRDDGMLHFSALYNHYKAARQKHDFALNDSRIATLLAARPKAKAKDEKARAFKLR